MKVTVCPRCSEPYPDYLFEFQIGFRCGCGVRIKPPIRHEHSEPVIDMITEVGDDELNDGVVAGPEELSDPTEPGASPEPAPAFPPDVPNVLEFDSDTRSEEEARERDRIREENAVRDEVLAADPVDSRNPHEPTQQYEMQFDRSQRELISPNGWEQERRSRELRRRADRICYLIVSTDSPTPMVESEMKQLRERCVRYFPEIRDAYENVYEPRFLKLWREYREL